MCGIVGTYGWTDTGTLDRAVACLERRGPDGTGRFVDEDEGVMMGMRRLAIVDLDGGSQPMYNESGSVVVTFNGEIYNYPQLREQLESKGHRFESNCDTEVLVHLWEEYGERTPEQLEGMFAFSLYDRDRECLFLARDRLGIKPLYYASTDRGIAWASEVRALLETDVSRTVDPHAVHDFFALGYAPRPRTLFDSIRKVQPGTSLLISSDRESISERRYWRLQPGQASSMTPTGASDRIRELLEQSVDRRLMADVPVGAFLSGGLDSSAIVGLLSERTDDLQTFSIGFQGDRYDESDEASFVAEHFGTDHTNHVVDLSSMSAFEDAVCQYGDPLADPAVLPTMLLSERASIDRKVVLTGEGADELFFGYPFYQKIDSTRSRVETVPTSVFAPLKYLERHGPKRLAPYFGYAASLRDDEPYLLGRLRSFRRRPDSFLNFGSSDAGDSGLRQIVQQAFEGADDGRVQRLSAFALLYPLVDRLLYKVDHATMYHSLEARVPFLDHELVEFAHSIPDKYKRVDGYKPILNRAVSDVVPERVRTRTKSGFDVPIDRWFRESHPAIESSLTEDRIDAAPYLSSDTVFEQWDAHRRNEMSIGGFLWRCLTYVDWYHEFATD